MAGGDPSVMEQQPGGGGVNKPTSGTYGEAAALDRLQSALPTVDRPGNPGPNLPPVGPMPQPQQPTGLPQSILAPTKYPEVPTATPLEMPAPAPTDPRGASLELLLSLIQSPDVSEATKTWARMVVDRMSRG